MALVAGLLAGLVPGTQPQAQLQLNAPGPNDGKVLTETDTDSAGLALPQGLAEQAAAAAGVARAVVTVDPNAAGPRAANGLAHALVTIGEPGQQLGGKEHGLARAQAVNAIGEAPRGGGAAAVSFTIMPVGTAQIVADPSVIASPAAMTAAAATPAPAALPTETEATTAPLTFGAVAQLETDSEAGTAPDGDADGKQDAPKAPIATPQAQTSAAQDKPAAVSTSTAGTAEKVDTRDDAPPVPAAAPTASTERPKDVGPAKALPAHSPTQLAHELVDHLRVAVREEGREIQIHLRPAELGAMTIRVTMQDGVLQAHIAADRPESARLLEQSLRHLEDMLADRGYEMGSLDVNTGGPDARETSQRAHEAHNDNGQGRGRGHDNHNHGDLVGADSAPAAVVMHDGDVNVLA
jgi:flagellar hook-length control protein FliK